MTIVTLTTASSRDGRSPFPFGAGQRTEQERRRRERSDDAPLERPAAGVRLDAEDVLDPFSGDHGQHEQSGGEYGERQLDPKSPSGIPDHRGPPIRQTRLPISATTSA